MTPVSFFLGFGPIPFSLTEKYRYKTIKITITKTIGISSNKIFRTMMKKIAIKIKTTNPVISALKPLSFILSYEITQKYKKASFSQCNQEYLITHSDKEF